MIIIIIIFFTDPKFGSLRNKIKKKNKIKEADPEAQLRIAPSTNHG
jgi:hypothetical protein